VNIGVHLSLGRNPAASLRDASAAGASSAQIFASSPGAWRHPAPLDEAAALVREACRDHCIAPLLLHAIYLINLASDDPLLASRSRNSLKATLRAGSMLGATGVITHIGSHQGRGFEAVAAQVAEALVEIMADSPEDTCLVLENSAGSGGIIGSRLEELAQVLELAGHNPRLKVAVDTAHLCAAGWDLRDMGSCVEFVDQFDALIGLDRLAAVHANDSKTEPGSRLDRHAIIGEGHIGIEGFNNLLAQRHLRRVPWILETPDLGSKEPGERFKSLRTLRELAHRAVDSEIARAS
jgi:deoxyribonuclease IV